MSESPFLSVIIPAYNEAERISSSLDSALEYLETQPYTYEILVVDDGSTDDTVRVVKNYVPKVQILTGEPNKGKGYAVRRGMIQAKGQIRLFTDADFSTPLKEVEKLLSVISDNQPIVIGSRRLDRTLVKKHQPWYRELIGIIGNKIISTLLFGGIEDTQCGFKALTASATMDIFPTMKIDGFGFDVELLYLAKRQGIRITQIPVEWFNDERSRLNPIRDSIRTFQEVISIKRLHRQ